MKEIIIEDGKKINGTYRHQMKCGDTLSVKWVNDCWTLRVYINKYNAWTSTIKTGNRAEITKVINKLLK